MPIPPTESLRRCARCKQLKRVSLDPASSEFGKASREKDGIRRTCKSCENEASRRSKAKMKKVAAVRAAKGVPALASGSI